MNEDKKDINQISALHTLEGDLLASMKDENYGSNIVKIVTQGKGSKSALTSTEDTSVDNPNLKKYILTAVVVVLGAAATLFYSLNLPGENTDVDPEINNTNNPNALVATSTPKIQSVNIFEADVVIPMEITNGVKGDFVQKIAEAESELIKNKVADKLNVSFLLDANLDDLFNKLQYSGPNSLLRSISEDQAYNFGVYHVTGTEFEKYLLMKIDIFDLGFSGMLEWEKFLPVDLEKIFTFTTTNNSSSTASTQNAPLKFTDRVIKNIDTRTYIDTQKGVRITYGFINKQYLLITSGENAFADIVNKLLINNVLR